jgi:hypothetical protein
MFGDAEGILPLQVVLDPDVGSEVVLLWIDRTPFVHELQRIAPFDLILKTGVANTSHGPLIFLLFWVPDPVNPDQPFAVAEAHANPFNSQHITTWRDLARQSHWHLFLVGAGDEQAGFFEFENTFSLVEALNQVERACQGMPHDDFNLAKAEFCEKYSIEDLFQM